MDKLYAVIGASGTDCRREGWIVTAYLDEAKARRHAELAHRWYVEHRPPVDCEDWGWWSKNANPYDPSMRVQGGEPEWQVRSLDLRDELPAPPVLMDHCGADQPDAAATIAS